MNINKFAVILGVIDFNREKHALDGLFVEFDVVSRRFWLKKVEKFNQKVLNGPVF